VFPEGSEVAAEQLDVGFGAGGDRTVSIRFDYGKKKKRCNRTNLISKLIKRVNGADELAAALKHIATRSCCQSSLPTFKTKPSLWGINDFTIE
jgi:hypothetical protein